ncbi:MAG: hypothetical protein ABIQ44_07210, partial [Chloroflexia bacterium]
MEQHFEITHSRDMARCRFDLRVILSLVVLAIAGIAILSAQTGASAATKQTVYAPNAPAASMTPVPANSRYSLLTTKPFGIEGVVNELSLHVWGPYSWRNGGDPYSPIYDPAAGSPVSPNPWHADQPYGYL